MANKQQLPALQTGVPLSTRKPSLYSAYSPDSSYSDSSDLPFPLPLARSAFLAPDFTPTDFLSTLSHRHQTLSDLRSELQSRSSTIAAELLALVNAEYQAFLTLGTDLRGGEERVEEVRMGVLGFAGGVEGVKSAVGGRRVEVQKLLREREAVRKEIMLGRGLVMVGERVEELENALSLGEDGGAWSEDDEDTSDEEDDGSSDESRGDGDRSSQPLVNVARLQRLARQFVGVRNQIERFGGSSQPFLAKQEEKLSRIKSTLLLDLSVALTQSKSIGKRGNRRVIRILGLYSELDEVKEATKMLKESAKR